MTLKNIFLALSLIKQGLHINTIAVNFTKTLNSAVRRFYAKHLKTHAKQLQNVITVKATNIKGCVQIVNNTVTSKMAQVLRVGSVHTLSSINIFADVYGFRTVVL